LYIYFTVETGAENVISQKAVLPGFLNCLLQDVYYPCILTSYINVCSVGTKCVRRNDEPFNKQMWKKLHQVAVFERSGLRLVGITNQVTGNTLRLCKKAPFHPGRKSRAAATAKTALFHFLHYVGRRHLEGLFYRRITAVAAISIEVADAFYIDFVD
jgi:hypothetical protein